MVVRSIKQAGLRGKGLTRALWLAGYHDAVMWLSRNSRIPYGAHFPSTLVYYVRVRARLGPDRSLHIP